jgi:hypothetical protein
LGATFATIAETQPSKPRCVVRVQSLGSKTSGATRACCFTTCDALECAT